MLEPDVTLTDFALALECAVFCVLLSRDGASALRRWWIVFFASIGAAALVGGLVHGFFPEPDPVGATLWIVTMLLIGVTSAAAWSVGALLGLPAGTQQLIRQLAISLLVIYTAVVLFVDDRFMVAIAMYLPATVFLLMRMIRLRNTPGIAGLLLIFAGAAVQQLGVGLHPVYFNHNALYHVIQAVALFLLFRSARSRRAR
jgi:hypothetical protein